MAAAHAARIGVGQVKRELKSGTITFEQALADPRSPSLRVGALLLATPGVGCLAVAMLLIRAGVRTRTNSDDPNRRVRELTERQRMALVDAVANLPGIGIRRAA
jgi:hypothetical protein